MKTKLYVYEGRVNCPRRGDIDVDTCFVCPDLLDVRQENEEEVLVCTPRMRPHLDDPIWIRW